MKKYVLTVCLIALAVSLAGTAARAQSGGVAAGAESSTVRDIESEKRAKHELEVARWARAEEDDRLAVHHPVLRAAETQNVNARVRHQLSERDAEVRRRVRHPRTVNVQK